MNSRLTAALAAAAMTALAVASSMPPCGPAGRIKPTFTATVDGVEHKDDVSRYHLVLRGRPHTSGRIDSVTVVTDKGRHATATDIDGVDMKRYFQFEDNGEIEVEIDFLPLPRGVKTMTLHTVHGPVDTTTGL